jgi:hypothetical protein
MDDLIEAEGGQRRVVRTSEIWLSSDNPVE